VTCPGRIDGFIDGFNLYAGCIRLFGLLFRGTAAGICAGRFAPCDLM